MSDYLKQREREKKLEQIRGKAKHKAPAPKGAARPKYTGDLTAEYFEDQRAQQRLSMARRELAEGGVSREELRRQGYRAIAKHSDLLEHGYQIVVWLQPTKRELLYEYAPATRAQKHNKGMELPRMTATTIEEQQAIHAALGVRDDTVCETQLDLFGESPRKKRRKRA